MIARALSTTLGICGLAATAAARTAEHCVTPASSYKHYHPAAGETDRAAAQAAVYDEISICRTASGNLAFALSIAGEKGDRCDLEGQAKPRQKGVFVFLDGGFRLQIELVGDRVRISERSDPKEGRKYCGASASIGDVEFKRRSGPPAN